MVRRVRIEETDRGLDVLVVGEGDRRAVRLGTLVVGALVVGLIGDSVLMYRAMRSVVTAATAVPFVLLFVVSLYWTPIVYTWLWNLSGREIVRAHGGRLRVERVVGRNMRFAFDFDMLDVSHVRVSPEPDDPANLTLRHQQARFGLGGNVAFEAEGRPYRVGIGLSEAEATQLAEAMRRALDRGSALSVE